MTARILLAGLYHETHTFVGDITRADAVRLRRGEELLARRGDASTVDGFLNVAARESWRVVPLLEIGAMPSGTLDHAVFEAFWTEFERGARAAMDARPRRRVACAPRRDGDDRLARSRGRVARAHPRSAGLRPAAAVRRVRPARDLHAGDGATRRCSGRLPREPAHRCVRHGGVFGGAAGAIADSPARGRAWSRARCR